MNDIATDDGAIEARLESYLAGEEAPAQEEQRVIPDEKQETQS